MKIKKIGIVYKNISNVLFLSASGVEVDIKNERKRLSRMWENAYWSIKNPKASTALKQALDPDHK